MPMQHSCQGSGLTGMLRRSRTLHHRPPPQEYRRRASHPASPSYCAAMLNHSGGVAPRSDLELGLPEERKSKPHVELTHAAVSVLSPKQQATTQSHLLGTMPHELCCDNKSNHNDQIVHYDWQQSQERRLMSEPLVMERDRNIERETEQERQMQREKVLAKEQQIQEEIMLARLRQQEFDSGRPREQQCFPIVVHPPQQSEINETWPKPAGRQSQGSGGGGGLYSTLEAHIGAGAGNIPGWHLKKGPQNINPYSKLNPSQHPNTNLNPNSRISRNQLLRDRASQLADERSGMSTDDETNTDMLMGRYWSRTERREHFLLAREQRQQQQQARGGATRVGVYRGGAPSRGDGEVMDSRRNRSYQTEGGNTVLELSQRKLSRLRNRKLFDDWTTVEELLTHGTRLGSREDMLCPNSLLTVTTV